MKTRPIGPLFILLISLLAAACSSSVLPTAPSPTASTIGGLLQQTGTQCPNDAPTFITASTNGNTITLTFTVSPLISELLVELHRREANSPEVRTAQARTLDNGRRYIDVPNVAPGTYDIRLRSVNCSPQKLGDWGRVVTATITEPLIHIGTPDVPYQPPSEPDGPTTRADCKDGGWENYDFDSLLSCFFWVDERTRQLPG